MSWVSVLAGFLVAHMVGDYLLQTDWQARHKRGGLGGDPVARRALSATSRPTRWRSCRRSSGSASELDVVWAIVAAVLVFVPHLIIDDGRLVALYLAASSASTGSNLGVAASVDQSFHVLSLFLAAMVIGAA